jgi:ATP-dependent helicase/DNAse subunit B
MMIYRILDKMKDEFKVFAKAATPGFVNTLTALITDLNGII